MYQTQSARWRLPHKQEKLGAHIHAARRGRGIPQDEMVRDTSLSLSTLRKIENGRTPNPGLFTLHRIWIKLNLPWKALGLVAHEDTLTSTSSLPHV